MRSISLMTLLALLIITTARAETPEELAKLNQEKAVAFLRKHVLDKTFTETHEILIDNKKIKSNITTETRFSDLQETGEGFHFLCEKKILQTNVDLDDAGKPKGEPVNRDRKMKMHYFIGPRQSTGELLGYAVNLDNEHLGKPTNYPYSCNSLRMTLPKDEVVIVHESVIYSDLFAKNGKWRPGNAVMTLRLVTKDGKTSMWTKIKGYDVDPATGKQKLSDDLPEVEASLKK